MFENISVKQALKLVYEKEALLFDLRGEEEYRKGHLPMAELVAEEELFSRLTEEKKKGDKKIILYCAFGNHSMLTAREYAEAGYENMASIVGGYHAYEGYVEAQKNQLWTMEWKRRG